MEASNSRESGGDFEEMVKILRRFLEIIGEDPGREGLRETPRRVARMWLEELASGYRVSPEDFVKTFNLEADNGEEDIYSVWNNIVIVYDIPVRSMCEHHLLPIMGTAAIAYIPGNKILGFSKFARIVDAFSRRLQVQERLTNQIADFMMSYLEAKGAVVVVEAIHLCALHRGIKEPLKMITRAVRGVFEQDQGLRREVIDLMRSRADIQKILLNDRGL